jgi:uncharacterized membrane protein YhdT
MAEIKVERKGRSIWPWIVGLVVLALVVWLVLGYFGGGAEGVTDAASGAVESVQSP